MAMQAVNGYKQTQAHASTPLERVVLLYDGAVRYMENARDAIGRRDIPARRDALSRTLAIVAELQSTLDMDRGGDLAVELDRIYHYVMTRLMDAAVNHDARAIDDARRVLDILREAWRTVAVAPPLEARP